MKQVGNYIGGKYTPGRQRRWIDVYEPATAKIVAQVPASGPEDLEDALRAAKSAFPAWAALGVEERAQFLDRLARGIEARSNDLALAESQDNGKPLRLAQRVDIPRAAQNFSFFASALRQFASESHRVSPELLNITLRQPIGIAACISPWNLPLYLFSWKIAPALAAGNCVIGKPSEVTPMTAALLGEILADCNFPSGVLNIVHGRGHEVGLALVTHPDIGVVSFTGGTQTGASIATAVAPQFKKLSLELGGKNPCIVFDDADFDAALDGALRAGFSNQGQICLCGSRLLVQSGIYESFRDALVDRVNALKVGDPLDESTDQGALVSGEHLSKVLGYLELAREEGARILSGGKQWHGEGRVKNGWFMQPTVLGNLGADSRCNQEEIFGPVLSIMSFDTEAEALQLANNSRYGLAASLWTNDLGRAHRLAEDLVTGIVWINCWMERDLRTPFGGMRHSGLGREGGFEALRFFSETKNVCIKTDRSGDR